MPNGDAPMSAAFGPYRTVRLLGQGTLGRVFLALDDQGQAVALKVITLDPGQDAADASAARSRFLVEAYATRALRHINIAAVLAAGEERGYGWMAMELVPGADLTRYTRMPRLLPDAVVLRIGERVARALACAHQAGIVHRDLKPANVMVDWPTDTLKLTDFGLARLQDAQATRTGLVLGSPSYMSPEQLSGTLPSPASDLYALGVTLFELLSGRLPHEAATLGDLLRRVATVPAPALTTLRPQTAAAVALLVQRLLSARVRDRPALAADVADELAALGAAPLRAA